MTAFLIVSTIAGAILGLRFKVFVLGPVVREELRFQAGLN